MDMIKQRIEELKNIYGNISAIARALDIDRAYLWRLQNGEKTNPSEKILKKLGLKRIVKITFEKV